MTAAPKVKIEVSQKVADELKEIVKDNKYGNTHESAIYDLLTFRSRVLNRIEARKRNARARRIGGWIKFWVKPGSDREAKIEKIKERMAAEVDGWETLGRVDQSTHVLDFLLAEHEAMDAQRAVPIGGSVGPMQYDKNCPRCLAEVGQVWLDGEPVYEDGKPRIVALRNDDLIRKDFADLLAWKPEFGYAIDGMDEKLLESYQANGASEADGLPPFLSNLSTFEILGKEDGRTFRAYFNSALKKIGLDDLTF